MIEDKIVDDFNASIKKIGDIREWLDRLYYNPEYSNFFNKLILGTLMSACKYLIDNFVILRDKYQSRKSF